MVIEVISSLGVGSTPLSAFDNALKKAGVYNYNLISLSSVVPVGARVVKKSHHKTPKNEIGYRLYVVKADLRSSESDKVIAAGLGWYILKNGGGVFVEHEVEGLTKDAVLEEIRYKMERSLQDLCAFRGEKYHRDKAQSSIAYGEVTSHPCCALTIALYKSEPW